MDGLLSIMSKTTTEMHGKNYAKASGAVIRCNKFPHEINEFNHRPISQIGSREKMFFVPLTHTQHHKVSLRHKRSTFKYDKERFVQVTPFKTAAAKARDGDEIKANSTSAIFTTPRARTRVDEYKTLNKIYYSGKTFHGT